MAAGSRHYQQCGQLPGDDDHLDHNDYDDDAEDEDDDAGFSWI